MCKHHVPECVPKVCILDLGKCSLELIVVHSKKLYACTYVCMHLRMYVCMFVCMNARMYVFMSVYVHIHTLIYTTPVWASQQPCYTAAYPSIVHIYIYIYIYIHIYTYTYTHTHTHTHIDSFSYIHHIPSRNHRDTQRLSGRLSSRVIPRHVQVLYMYI